MYKYNTKSNPEIFKACNIESACIKLGLTNISIIRISLNNQDKLRNVSKSYKICCTEHIIILCKIVNGVCTIYL